MTTTLGSTSGWEEMPIPGADVSLAADLVVGDVRALGRVRILSEDGAHFEFIDDVRIPVASRNELRRCGLDWGWLFMPSLGCSVPVRVLYQTVWRGLLGGVGLRFRRLSPELRVRIARLRELHRPSGRFSRAS